MRARGSWGEGLGEGSSRHLCTGWKGASNRSGREVGEDGRREGEREEGGREKELKDDGTEAQRSRYAAHGPRSSLCQPSAVRLCPRPPPTHPTAHQSLVCDSGTSPSPSSAATRELRGLVSSGTPGSRTQGEEGASPTGTRNGKQLTYHCPFVWEQCSPQEPRRPERKSLDNDLPSPIS